MLEPVGRNTVPAFTHAALAVRRNVEKVMLLTEERSTYIPLGATHRLANLGKLPLEMIEVQSRSYSGEDDIVRSGDSYGRQYKMRAPVPHIPGWRSSYNGSNIGFTTT